MKHVFSKKNRALLAELVRTDFKLRYQGSALGYAWSLLRPLMIFLILYIVFVRFLRFGGDIEHFPIYLLLGIVLWNFFAEMTNQSLTSIVSRADLIRKVKIPRWIIVLSSSISAVINLILNLLVVFILMIIAQVPIMYTIALLPFSLFELYLFALGCSLLLSALFVKYRDIVYIWEVFLQAGFYATPVLYTMSMIENETAQKILLLNPVAKSIQSARYELVTHQTTTTYSVFNGGWYYLIPTLFVILLLVFSIRFFRKQSKDFAENI